MYIPDYYNVLTLPHFYYVGGRARRRGESDEDEELSVNDQPRRNGPGPRGAPGNGANSGPPRGGGRAAIQVDEEFLDDEEDDEEEGDDEGEDDGEFSGSDGDF